MRLPLPYAIGSSMVSFFLPAMVMVILYTKLYLYARKHVRSIKTQLQQATSFLIMQLASEKIREVIIYFHFLDAPSRIVFQQFSMFAFYIFLPVSFILIKKKTKKRKKQCTFL